MRKFFRQIGDYKYRLLATVTVAAMTAENANANDLGTAADSLLAQVGSVGKLMVAGSFVGGIVMLGSGLMKLKQAADTQGNQVKYSEGMWRVGVGAGLVAIPAFGGMLTETFSLGSVTMTDRGGASF